MELLPEDYRENAHESFSDVRSKYLSCLYLDKPLKAHTLMQTIARANRVSAGKSNGLIIDYIGIVKALRKALADYTANTGKGGDDPTIDKDKLIERILETIDKVKQYFKNRDFSIHNIIDATGFRKMQYLRDAADIVCGSIEDRKTFSTYASEIGRLIKYTDRSDITGDSRKEYEAIAAVYSEIQKKRKRTDTTDLMIEINNIINQYVIVNGNPNISESNRQFDISRINFELLIREFARVKHKNLVMKDLEEAILVKLNQMVFSKRDT